MFDERVFNYFRGVFTRDESCPLSTTFVHPPHVPFYIHIREKLFDVFQDRTHASSSDYMFSTLFQNAYIDGAPGMTDPGPYLSMYASRDIWLAFLSVILRVSSQKAVRLWADMYSTGKQCTSASKISVLQRARTEQLDAAFSISTRRPYVALCLILGIYVPLE